MCIISKEYRPIAGFDDITDIFYVFFLYMHGRTVVAMLSVQSFH